MPVELTYGLTALPAAVVALFEHAGSRSLYTGLDWFRLLARTTGIDDRDCIVAAGPGNGRIDAAILLERRRQALHRPAVREIGGLANYYTMIFSPVVAPSAAQGAVRELVAAVARSIGAVDLFDLQALPDAPELLQEIESGFRDAGFRTARYECFGNWFEPVNGDSFEAYLARRPAMLRNLLRRKGKRAESAGIRFEIVGSDGDIDRAVAAYEAVYRTSWKIEEPHPEFMPALIRHAAARRMLRLGVAWSGDRAIAGQVWLIENGAATIYKLAHDEGVPEISPGSLLTAAVMRRVIEVDRVGEVDFGRGDDPYKQLWLSRRRPRWGILAASPFTPGGIAAMLRHVALPRLLASLRRASARPAAGPAEPSR